ncbi:tRNA N6-adenosine threonylcarbamoyltransferase, mitochondrial-like isoform X1 [Mytilus californianus]|uniref:tRNA N6-adenosine threonylcarbamoyltransferase, mitochondrial-like isoform X1 n=2 Tax=Mytilus californianus TaxID=6549 RepID=UPI002246847E|nr:tRNA N6-adenosine threonylcarbamoyltransferase, mitochondrial-like isoform X1 [Mytilus californianus]
MFTFSRLTYLRNIIGNAKKNKTLDAGVRVISLRKVGTHPRLVLGIETSCDDTGAAVVDDKGNILGDALNSQTKVHVDHGGIIPSVAQDLHRENIDTVVQEALKSANVVLQDLEAIAVTNKPGLALSLRVGLEYAKELVEKSSKPMIPIHHMEAHALTVRLLKKVDFPYLVFLMSGGHCLLAVANDIDDFDMLGTSLDEAPGDCIDKTARSLCLKNLPQCEGLSGGGAIEMLAENGNPLSFPVPHVMTHYRDCDFSFTGLKTYFKRLIHDEATRQDLPEGQLLSNVSDVCAALQYAMTYTLCRKLQRAFMYSELKGLLPEQKRVLVASGGVASNQYIRRGLTQVCDMFSCQLICPPPHLCTDNGIMIAWNGMEKLMAGKGIAEDPMSVRFEPKFPFGIDRRDDVRLMNIKLPKLKLKS